MPKVKEIISDEQRTLEALEDRELETLDNELFLINFFEQNKWRI